MLSENSDGVRLGLLTNMLPQNPQKDFLTPLGQKASNLLQAQLGLGEH